MFEENENLVNATENVEEQTTEENVPVEGETETVNATEESEPEQKQEESFTKSQVDEMIAKKLARKEAKIRKEFENKYGRLETVLNTGLGTSNTSEAIEKLTEFYSQKGITIPDVNTSLSDRDIEALAESDAKEIISLGYDEIKDEVDRLANTDIEKMSKRDKLVFTKLANERQRIEDEKDLASIGVNTDAINEKDFQDFANKLNPKMSLKEKYEMYLEFKPKPKVETMGSMKSAVPQKTIKEFYTPEEARKLTMKDLDDPKIMEAVEKSMALWEQNK